MQEIQTGSAAAQAFRRVLTPVVLAVAVLISLIGFAPSAALAHGPDANGCSAVPDSGYGFSFHDICDDHDRCYGNKPYGSGRSGRRACDKAFRTEMFQHCKQHRLLSSKRAACNAVAGAYYIGVRVFGHPSWQTGQPTLIA